MTMRLLRKIRLRVRSLVRGRRVEQELDAELPWSPYVMNERFVMMKVFFGAAVLIVVAVVAHAQAALTGKWQGESPNGSQVMLEVKATETALTGTLAVDGQRLPLVDGKLSKNTFTFKVMLPPNDQTQEFNGELAQDQVKLWMDRRGPSSAAILTRVKS